MVLEVTRRIAFLVWQKIQNGWIGWNLFHRHDPWVRDAGYTLVFARCRPEKTVGHAYYQEKPSSPPILECVEVDDDNNEEDYFVSGV